MIVLGMKKGKKLGFNMMDWDKQFRTDMESGLGFLIDTSIDYEDYLDTESIEHMKKLFTLDSIYSYKFGFTNQIDSSDPVLKKMYTCKCHETFGIEKYGQPCDKCGTIVQRSIPMTAGWIDLVDYKVLHPYICYLLMKTKTSVTKEGNKLVLSSTKSTVKTDDEENAEENNDDENQNNSEETQEESTPRGKKRKRKAKKRDDNSVSLFELLTKRMLDYSWEDIIYNGQAEVFFKKYFRTGHAPEMLELMKGKWFVSKIRVISTNYRPLKIENKVNLPEVIQDPQMLNVKYMSISNSAKQLHENYGRMIRKIEITYLVEIMKCLGQIFDKLVDVIGKGKGSLMRGEIFSRRFYNSGRLILEPIIDDNIHDIDVCQVPTDFFRVAFEKSIQELLDNYHFLSPSYRNRITNVDAVLSLEERKFIKEEVFPNILNKYVYINREPSIYVTSTLGLRIHSLTDDEYSATGNELVIRINGFLLPAIAGDYDGDEISIITWDGEHERKRIFEVMSPKRSIVDTGNLRYNNQVGPNNNLAVLLYKGFDREVTFKKVL